MKPMKEIIRRLAWLGRRAQFDEELDAEVRFHIETRAEELAAAGTPRAAALAQARREFGSPACMAEETRSAWQFRWLEDLASDLRYAARSFRRNPAFAATAVACLALGIGANTTIFSVAAEVLFSQPSVRDASSLILIRMAGSSHSDLDIYRFVRDANVFPEFAGQNENGEVNWRRNDGADRLFAIHVTGNLFGMAGIPLAMGRGIQPGDTDVAVVSWGFWQSRLGADPNVLGRSMVLDGHPTTIAGVLPRDHRTLAGFGFIPDLYLPLSADTKRVALFARLPEGMTRQIAAARLQSVSQQLDRIHPHEGFGQEVEVSALAGAGRLDSPEVRTMAAFFAMLMVVVGLVLLIACANVASLLLARASSRAHELAIRLSIGASRGRIVRQLFADSLILAFAGTAAGLALNLVLTRVLSGVRLPVPLPIQFRIEPDWRLLAYAAAVALGSSLVAGLIPAIRGTRAALGAALKHGERQVSRGRWTASNVLVTSQLAVSIVLLCAAFLFLRNLMAASTMNPGFDTGHTVWAYMRLAPEAYPDQAKTRPLIDTAVDNLEKLPGVEAASIARVVPLNDVLNFGTTAWTDVSPDPLPVHYCLNYVGPDYFKTMRIPIVAGRAFTPADRMGAPPVAILNENLARRLFGSRDPVGHTVRLGGKNPNNSTPILIAGVARNSKYFTLGEENMGGLYQPYAQWEGSIVNLHFLIRASGNPQGLIPAVNAALSRLDPTAALETKTIQQSLAFAMVPSRVGAAVLGTMGALGLVLASIGLYGVLLYSVSRRNREIGLRMALGATPRGILRMVLRQSGALAATGIAIGLTLAFFAVRPLAMFLTPEIRTTDLTNFAVVALVLVLVALAATVAPALRATRVDPVVALREE